MNRLNMEETQEEIEHEYLWWAWGCVLLQPHAGSQELPSWLRLWTQTESPAMHHRNRPGWEQWSAS